LNQWYTQPLTAIEEANSKDAFSPTIQLAEDFEEAAGPCQWNEWNEMIPFGVLEASKGWEMDGRL
jgi:hypothetical protein